jgi:bleomycin hydrolase
MKASLVQLAWLVASTAIAHAQEPIPQPLEQRTFTREIDLPTTTVKSQDNTGTCWGFATTSYIESEIMREGGQSIDLSEMYIVRQIYMQKAEDYIRWQGKTNYGQGGLSHDQMSAVDQAGLVPEDVFPGNKIDSAYNHEEFEAVSKAFLDALLRSKDQLSPYWQEAYSGILDAYFGKEPENFTYDGKTFTPQGFTTAVLKFDATEYVEVTSFTHHPFYKEFVLEIPDNFAKAPYQNVPIDELEDIVDNALASGYTVTWDGDVSEDGFAPRTGIADVASPEKEISKKTKQIQQERQQGFDKQETTDDHLMHITGLASDPSGRKFYVIKNSWGDELGESGYLYMSKEYFRQKTIAIMVHKDAVPKDIARKIGLS